MSHSASTDIEAFKSLSMQQQEYLAMLLGSYSEQRLGRVPIADGTPRERLDTTVTHLYFEGNNSRPLELSSPGPSIQPGLIANPPSPLVSRIGHLRPIDEEPENDQQMEDTVEGQDEDGNVIMREPTPAPPTHPLPSQFRSTSALLRVPASSTVAPLLGETTPSGPVRHPRLTNQRRQPYPSPTAQQSLATSTANHQPPETTVTDQQPPASSPSDERPSVPSSVTKLRLDVLDPRIRTWGVKDPRDHYTGQRVRASRRPGRLFMDDKREEVGDENFHLVLSGELCLEDAMEKGYSVQRDPSKSKLPSVPRTRGQRAFPKALRLHYRYLIKISRDEFPHGVPSSVASLYNAETNYPSEMRFSIDWTTSLRTKWNVAARWFFAANFVDHVDQYKAIFELPEYADNVKTVFNQFTSLLATIRHSTSKEDGREAMNQAVAQNVTKNWNNRVRSKFERRLRTCQDVKVLQQYTQLANDIGPDGVSDEETDDEELRVLGDKSLTRKFVLEPQYRSKKYRAFMRLLDEIKDFQDSSPLINPKQRPTDVRRRRIDSDRACVRDTPLGLPKVLYSEEFISKVESTTGLDLKYTEKYKDLPFPPVLPAQLLRNLNISPEELARRFQS